MLTTYYTLRYIASTLHSTLTGSQLSEAFTQQKDELVLRFDGEGRNHLIVSCRPDAATCYLHPAFARARRNTVNLLTGLSGKLIEAVTILPGDRIIRFHCMGGDLLVLSLFGPKANVFHVSNERTIKDAFRSPFDYRGVYYDPPAQEPLYDFPLLSSQLEQGGNMPVMSILKHVFPLFGSTLVREVIYRSGLETSARATQITGTWTGRIVDVIQAMLQEVETPDPRLYSAGDGVPITFSLIPLHHARAYREEMFRDVHAAIRLFLAWQQKRKRLQEKKSVLLSRLRRELDKLQRSIAAAEKEHIQRDRAAEYQEWGTLLLGNPFSGHAASLRVESESGPVTIPLDRRHTVAQNAQEYFRKARQARLASERAHREIPTLRARTAAAEALADLLESAHTPAELDAMMKTHGRELDAFGLGPKSKERESIPFRIFTVDGGYEVWAGKSGANNDLLTMKYAKPADLWFHARGSSGSHVLLRCPSGKSLPGKRAREQAAAIAAYYSRMKTAGTVPVAMTERKYVRKPRGAPPGTVTLERETVLFVKPGLPKASQPADAE